jgi:hydrogenase maturation protease
VTTTTRCRALVAGFGRPGMRDLDFGRQLVRYLEGLGWPEGVVVEDASYAALLVLHRLQELEPAKVVLVGAVPRGFDPPGALRRYRLDPEPPPPEEVQTALEESVQGVVDLDHTLAVARQWGGLPAETVVIEVEPADCSFGLGFSETLAAAFDAIVAMVRDELGEAGPDTDVFDPNGVGLSTGGATAAAALSDEAAVAPSEALMDLVRYAHDHEQVRLVQAHRGVPLLDGRLAPTGLDVAGRSRPWGVTLDGGADWFDLIPLEDGWIGVVIGDVGGRGVEAAGTMADLRAAVRAYAVLDGHSPAQLVSHLDHLVTVTSQGEGTSLLYLALHPPTGELRLGNAGHCPPLVVGGSGESWFLRDALAGPLGAPRAARAEATLRMGTGSTLLLFSDGLVQGENRRMAEGLERLRGAARAATWSADDLCDRVLEVCTAGLRRDGDISLLALRLGA